MLAEANISVEFKEYKYTSRPMIKSKANSMCDVACWSRMLHKMFFLSNFSNFTIYLMICALLFV